MKKTISVLLGVILLFTLTACSCSKDKITPTDAPVSDTDIVDTISDNSADEASDSASKIVVDERSITYKNGIKINDETEIIGKPIDYKVGVDVKVDFGWHIEPTVATSYAQLVDAYDSANGRDYDRLGGENYIEKYDEAFFIDKDVIMLFIETGDGRYPYNIESVTVSDGTVYINQSKKDISTIKYDSYPTKMGYYRIFLEVDKSDMKNVRFLSDATWDENAPKKVVKS